MVLGLKVCTWYTIVSLSSLPYSNSLPVSRKKLPIGNPHAPISEAIRGDAIQLFVFFKDITISSTQLQPWQFHKDMFGAEVALAVTSGDLQYWYFQIPDWHFMKDTLNITQMHRIHECFPKDISAHFPTPIFEKDTLHITQMPFSGQLNITSI